jgi:hypothetical protein
MRRNKPIILMNITIIIISLIFCTGALTWCDMLSGSASYEEVSGQRSTEEDETGKIKQEIAEEDKPEIVINPEDINITFAPENPYLGKEFEIYIDIENPEIEIADLNYDVYIGDELIGNYNASPITVTAPDEEKDLGLVFYPPIKSGGEIKLKPHIAWCLNYTLDPIPTESGSIVEGVGVYNDGYIFIGDSDCNNPVIGFASFDIGKLVGAIINDANLNLKIKEEIGNIDENQLNSNIHCRSNPFTGSLFLSPTTLGEHGDMNIIGGSFSSNDTIEIGVFEGMQDHFQESSDRLVFIMASDYQLSNNNNSMDGYLIDVELEIDYIIPEETPSEPTPSESDDIGGIGTLLTLDEYGRILVLEAFPGSSALEAGIQEGDWIIAIDGLSVENIDIDTVAEKIMGPVGSYVAISIYRNEIVLYYLCKRQPLPE